MGPDSKSDSSTEPIAEPEPPPRSSLAAPPLGGPEGDCSVRECPAGECTVSLQNPSRFGDFSTRQLRPWAVAMLTAVAPSTRSLSVRFISDRAMRHLNHTYRGKDQPTDVLSFPGETPLAGEAQASGSRRPPDAAPPPGRARLVDEGDLSAMSAEMAALAVEEAGHLGDIAIAVPTAKRQARAAGHGLDRELRTLILHGVLHCLGYDHESDDGTMERLERRLRRRWLDHA